MGIWTRQDLEDLARRRPAEDEYLVDDGDGDDALEDLAAHELLALGALAARILQRPGGMFPARKARLRSLFPTLGRARTA